MAVDVAFGFGAKNVAPSKQRCARRRCPSSKTERKTRRRTFSVRLEFGFVADCASIRTDSAAATMSIMPTASQKKL